MGSDTSIKINLPVLFIGIVLFFSGCAAPPKKVESLQKPTPLKTITLKQGNATLSDGWQYKYNGFRYANHLKDYWGDGKPAKTENIFFVASITIQNPETDAKRASIYDRTTNITLKDTVGNTYQPLDADIYRISDSYRIKRFTLNPKTRKTFELAFEVPAQTPYTVNITPPSQRKLLERVRRPLRARN